MRLREISAQSFATEVDRDGLTLVKFTAPWCGPCKALNPIMEAAADEHPDVAFVEVNIDNEQQLARQFHIRGVPTILGFRKSQLVWQHVGLLSAGQLKTELSKH